MKTKPFLLSSLLVAFFVVAAACETNGTETPDGIDGIGTPTPIGGETPTPMDDATPTPAIGTGTPMPSTGTGTPMPGMGTSTPTPGIGIGTPMPGMGTSTPTPGIGTPDPGMPPAPGTVAPAPSPTIPPSAGLPLLGNVIFMSLSGVEGSTVSGTGFLVPLGDTTLVAIGLESAPEESYEAAVHQGTCDSLGDQAASLSPVTASTSLTMVNMTLSELQSQELAVVLFGAATAPAATGEPVACGAVPQS